LGGKSAAISSCERFGVMQLGVFVISKKRLNVCNSNVVTFPTREETEIAENLKLVWL
jgi:hypothetical protein